MKLSSHYFQNGRRFVYNIRALLIFMSLFHQKIGFIRAKKSIPSTKQNFLYPTTSYWNSSPHIDEEGFLKDYYRRIVGEWERETNIGGKYGYKSMQSRDIETMPVLIRQVPGDGNCLFHSLSVGLNFVEKKKHLDMNNNHESQYDIHDELELDDCTLQERSAKLRQIAVQMLTPVGEHIENSSKADLKETLTSASDDNNRNSKTQNRQQRYRHRRRRRKKPLFLQGNEYLYTEELLHIAASQYDLTGGEYCELMRRNGVWGGGPEIVAICNYLRRPIHVYELVSVLPTKRFKPFTTKKSKTWGNKNSSSDGNINGGGSAKKMLQPEFRLRRMACFGSPKFDFKEPIHILSADCRFPDINPGQETSNGNHFLAIFPIKKAHYLKTSSKMSPTRHDGFKVRSGGVGTGTTVVKDSNVSSRSDGKDTVRRNGRIHQKAKSEKNKPREENRNQAELDTNHFRMFQRWFQGPCLSLVDQWMELVSFQF